MSLDNNTFKPINPNLEHILTHQLNSAFESYKPIDNPIINRKNFLLTFISLTKKARTNMLRCLNLLFQF